MYYLSDLSKRLLKVACLNTLNFGIIFWYNFTKLLSFFSKKSSFGKGVFLRGAQFDIIFTSIEYGSFVDKICAQTECKIL